jgi:hypothetical protein
VGSFFLPGPGPGSERDLLHFHRPPTRPARLCLGATRRARHDRGHGDTWYLRLHSRTAGARLRLSITSLHWTTIIRAWLVEPRAGLMTRAGTVMPGFFACATRPRRLVKGVSRLVRCRAVGLSLVPALGAPYARFLTQCLGAPRLGGENSSGVRLTAGARGRVLPCGTDARSCLSKTTRAVALFCRGRPRPQTPCVRAYWRA